MKVSKLGHYFQESAAERGGTACVTWGRMKTFRGSGHHRIEE